MVLLHKVGKVAGGSFKGGQVEFYGGPQLPRQNQSFTAKFQFPQLPLDQFSR